MQPNKAGEFQIPNSIHHPDIQEPTPSEVDSIYQKIDGDTVEVSYSQHHEKLMFIGDEITRARQQMIERSANHSNNNYSGLMGAVSKIIFYPEYYEQQKQSKPVSLANLMQAESEIGSEIFNNRPDGDYIKFFNENRDHWFLYRESRPKNGVIQSHTIHYEVQPGGVLKTCDKTGPKFEYVGEQELNDFLTATNIYYSQVMSRMYNKNTTSSSKKAS